MKIYEIRHYYYVDTFGACDEQSENHGYYATKDIAMAHLSDEVEKTKFEYAPAPNEKPMWLNDNYYPFVIFDEDWKEKLKEEGWMDGYGDDFETAYENYLYEVYCYERASEYFKIKEIEVINA